MMLWISMHADYWRRRVRGGRDTLRASKGRMSGVGGFGQTVADVREGKRMKEKKKVLYLNSNLDRTRETLERAGVRQRPDPTSSLLGPGFCSTPGQRMRPS